MKERLNPGGQRTESPPAPSSVLEDGMNSVLGSGNRPPSCPPSSISVLRPGGRNLRTAPSSVLGSGNLAPSCPPSSISVLRPGGRSLRTELSISVLRPGGRNPVMEKSRPPSWRTEFRNSRIFKIPSSGRQDGIWLRPQIPSWRTGRSCHPPPLL